VYLMLFLACAGGPWLTGICWAIRHRPHDGAIPLSMGERARRQLAGR
jgi:hypothetical protein